MEPRAKTCHKARREKERVAILSVVLRGIKEEYCSRENPCPYTKKGRKIGGFRGLAYQTDLV